MSDETKNFIRAAGIRAVKTVAQSAIATIGTAVTISDVDLKALVGIAILAGVLSLLTSVVTGLPEVE